MAEAFSHIMRSRPPATLVNWHVYIILIFFVLMQVQRYG